MRSYQQSLSPAVRSARSKAAAEHVTDRGAVVRKSWKTIRADPVLLEKARSRLKKQAVQFWRDGDEEAKNRVLSALAVGWRSKGNDALAAAMKREGLYDGFCPEEVFHGFVPDDINHRLKLIVEYYGDFFHCNPLRYTDPSQYIGVIKQTVGQRWSRDRQRIAAFNKYGYRVVVVWESDFKRTPNDELKKIGAAIEEQKMLLCTQVGPAPSANAPSGNTQSSGLTRIGAS